MECHGLLIKYPSAQDFFSWTRNAQNEDSWAKLHRSDFIMASETLSHRHLRLLGVSPYQQELLRRGVQRHREDEVSTEALDQLMGYTGAVGTMLL